MMRMDRLFRWLTAGCVLLSAAPMARAHDTWLVPDEVRCEMVEPVRIRLMTGDVFPVSETATKPNRVATSGAMQGSRSFPFTDLGVEENSLAAHLIPDVPGGYVAGLTLHPHPITMEASEFEAYLREEEATRALELRGALGESGKPGQELYTKCAKTMVRFTESGGSSYKLVLGHPLEIVPLTDPFTWRSGGHAEVAVMFEGRRARGIRVCIGREGTRGHEYETVVRTDNNGEARLPLDRGGLWYVRTHAIRRLSAARAADHGPRLPTSSTGPDWESFWATFTFGVGADDGAGQAIEAVRAVHGGADPWAVLGYRMGQRALRELGLVRGSFDLEVVHETPMEVQYTCIADGVQAATGATIGRLNLRLTPAAQADLKTVFRHRATGAKVTIQPSEAFHKKYAGVPMHELADRGAEVARSTDEELMTVQTGP